MLQTQVVAHDAPDVSIAVISVNSKGHVACLVCLVYVITVRANLRQWGAVCSRRSEDEVDVELLEHVLLCCIFAIMLVTVLGCQVARPMPPSRADCFGCIFRVVMVMFLGPFVLHTGWLYATRGGTCAVGEVLHAGVPLLLVALARPRVTKYVREQNAAPTQEEVVSAVNGFDTRTWGAFARETCVTADVDVQCSICLCGWEQDDAVKITPCRHLFHEECIKAWLLCRMRDRSTTSCALCRAELVGVARGGCGAGEDARGARSGAEGPLAEVV